MKIRLLIGVLVTVLTTCSLHGEDFDNALAALWAGKIDQAVAILRIAGSSGNVRAQLFLRRLLLKPPQLGNRAASVKPDVQEALKWLTLASERGSGEASAAIADLYDGGRNLAPDPAKAEYWYDHAAKQGWDQQEIIVGAFQWERSPDVPLTCEITLIDCPAPDEMDLLRAAGLRGVLTPKSTGGRLRQGPKAHALIIADHQVMRTVHLKQPRHATAIWVQRESGWEVYPPGVPLLDRDVLLSRDREDPSRTSCYAIDVDGSPGGGSCFHWNYEN